ncbi:MAG: hypothetical protein HYY40_02380 [Bacteroidetes bacterium]|nr:hypothetical protein [Bacteroidota bacterium]
MIPEGKYFLHRFIIGQHINNVLTIGIVLLTFLFNSCFRKGDDDPFISLRSRTNRITGVWKLMEKTYQYNEKNSTDSVALVYKEVASSSSITITLDSLSETLIYSEKLGISKYGSYSWSKEARDKVLEPDIYLATSEEGYWTFAGKNEKQEIENKEAILFYFKHMNATAGNQTYSQNSLGMADGMFYRILLLRENELILLREFSESDINGSYRTVYHYSRWEKLEE